jgi:hypothetical protein
MQMTTSTVALSAEELRKPEFWRTQFAQLDLSGKVEADRHASEMPYRAADRAIDEERMVEDGYIQGHHPALATLAPKLAEAARHCIAMGLPPVFLFLFNDVWRCFYALAPAISPFLGSPLCALPDFWLWHVDPKTGDTGWSPHVDKGPYALDREGRPLSVTVWIPLSRATPLNSCIYLVPASRDPEYRVAERRRDPDVTDVRAVPVNPGEFLCWNQAILHWGSASSRFADEPRISMALEFQSAAIPPFNEPLIRDPEALDFDAKLRLIAKQILQYRHMYAVDPAVESLAMSLDR